MMTMKDIFYSFVNRNKVASSVDDSQQHHQQQIEVPAEAAEDNRILPGSLNNNKTKAKKTKKDLIASLEPYLHLLPDLTGMDIGQQRKLQKALYSAGISATFKLLQDKLKRKGSEDGGTEGGSLLDDLDVAELFEQNKSEDSARLTQLISQNMEEIMAKMDGGKALMNMIPNDVAADSLAKYIFSSAREPLTKRVESMMQAPNEAGNLSMMGDDDDEEDDDEEETESSQSSTQEQEEMMKRSASVGETETTTTAQNTASAKNGGGGGEKPRPNSCSRTRLGGTSSSGNNNGPKRRFTSNNASPPTTTTKGLKNDGDTYSIHSESDGGNDNVDNVVEEDELGDEDSLFRYVCAAGYQDLAKLLVSMRNSAEFTQQCDSTPLMEACCGGHADVVKTLLQAGADVNALSSTKNTALIYACASGHLQCVRELLAVGHCDLNLRNDAGHDAMMEAANIGNVDIMKLLVERGAKPSCVVDSVDYKESALTLASYKGHYETVEFLLSLMPAQKGASEEEELHTALMEAAMDGHVNIAKLLVDAGAKVNLAAESFENPLTLASCSGHIGMVKLLCEAGAELDKPNDEGYTPLMEASREGHLEIVEYLLKRGANVNAKIEEGFETSLTLAASGGFK